MFYSRRNKISSPWPQELSTICLSNQEIWCLGMKYFYNLPWRFDAHILEPWFCVHNLLCWFYHLFESTQITIKNSSSIFLYSLDTNFYFCFNESSWYASTLNLILNEWCVGQRLDHWFHINDGLGRIYNINLDE